MIGYKATYKGKCLNLNYEVGNLYNFIGNNVNICVCFRGFHFCKNLEDCFFFYSLTNDTVIFEVEALGAVRSDENKYVTDKLRIIREVPKEEIMDKVYFEYSSESKDKILKNKKTRNEYYHLRYDDNYNIIYEKNTDLYGRVISERHFEYKDDILVKLKDNFGGIFTFDEKNNPSSYICEDRHGVYQV